MRVSCPNCKDRFDIPNRDVVQEADRLKEIGKPAANGNIKTRRVELVLDELDYEIIQSYIADYQAHSRTIAPGKPTIIPDGESNLVGAIIAECVRDLMDFRDVLGDPADEET